MVSYLFKVKYCSFLILVLDHEFDVSFMVELCMAYCVQNFSKSFAYVCMVIMHINENCF